MVRKVVVLLSVLLLLLVPQRARAVQWIDMSQYWIFPCYQTRWYHNYDNQQHECTNNTTILQITCPPGVDNCCNLDGWRVFSFMKFCDWCYWGPGTDNNLAYYVFRNSTGWQSWGNARVQKGYGANSSCPPCSSVYKDIYRYGRLWWGYDELYFLLTKPYVYVGQSVYYPCQFAHIGYGCVDKATWCSPDLPTVDTWRRWSVWDYIYTKAGEYDHWDWAVVLRYDEWWGDCHWVELWTLMRNWGLVRIQCGCNWEPGQTDPPLVLELYHIN